MEPDCKRQHPYGLTYAGIYYSAVGLKTLGFPLAGTTLFKQSPL